MIRERTKIKEEEKTEEEVADMYMWATRDIDYQLISIQLIVTKTTHS